MSDPTRRTVHVERENTGDLNVVVGCQRGILDEEEATRLRDALTEALKIEGPRLETIGLWKIKEIPPGVALASDETDHDQWRIKIDWNSGESICILRHILPAKNSKFLRDELWKRAKSIVTAANAKNVEW